MEVKTLSAKELTTIGIGGHFRVYFPESIGELLNLVKDGNFFIVGGGSNLILPDRLPGDLRLVSLSRFKGVKIDGSLLFAGAGESLRRVVGFLLERKLSSIEFLSGIPKATIGGAVAQNAGAFGRSMSDVLSLVRFVDLRSLSVLEIDNFSGFSYRSSPFPDKGIVIEVALRVEERNGIRELVKSYVRRRMDKQPPFWLRTAGSTFKNPEGFSAGYLLDRAGLKGFRVGDLKFSEKHANFMVNTGSATFSQFEELVGIARERVREMFGVELELEVKTIGHFKV